MIGDLHALVEVVDQSRADRKLADKIEADLMRIENDINLMGYALVESCGTTYRIVRSATTAR